MSDDLIDFEAILDTSMCGSEIKLYTACMEKASKAKHQEKCKVLFKEYQFCLASLESERLSQFKYWESFKEKWGHYPNEQPSNKENT